MGECLERIPSHVVVHIVLLVGVRVVPIFFVIL